MTYEPDDVFFQLRRANPVLDDTLTQAQQERAERTLAEITALPGPAGTARRPRVLQWVAAAAAASVVVGVGVGVVPQQQARAAAEEALSRAAEASLSKPVPTKVTSSDYVRRVDESVQARVVSVLRTNVAGAVTVEQETAGDLPDSLRKAADDIARAQPIDPAADVVGTLASMDADHAVRSALGMLLSPGLTSQHQRDLYAFIADEPGNRVVNRGEQREGEVVHIERPGDGLAFSLLPASGQLLSVTGLVGPDVTTTVDAAGIIGCVNTTGVTGPEDISLACADDNYIVTDLRWEGWNSEEATAQGNAWINDCEPDCASGDFHTFPATVRASEKRSCGYSLEVYTRIEVDYSEPVKKGEPLAQPQSLELGCE